MGNPTYSGLEIVQAEFQETAFPLPGFRKEICGGPKFIYYSCGLQRHEFVAGIPADLHSLATDEPYGQPQNVALCAEDGGYGLRFVEEYFLRDACAFNPEREQALPYIAMQIEPRFAFCRNGMCSPNASRGLRRAIRSLRRASRHAFFLPIAHALNFILCSGIMVSYEAPSRPVLINDRNRRHRGGYFCLPKGDWHKVDAMEART
jgi:hypothetical protein